MYQTTEGINALPKEILQNNIYSELSLNHLLSLRGFSKDWAKWILEYIFTNSKYEMRKFQGRYIEFSCKKTTTLNNNLSEKVLLNCLYNSVPITQTQGFLTLIRQHNKHVIISDEQIEYLLYQPLTDVEKLLKIFQFIDGINWLLTESQLKKVQQFTERLIQYFITENTNISLDLRLTLLTSRINYMYQNDINQFIDNYLKTIIFQNTIADSEFDPRVIKFISALDIVNKDILLLNVLMLLNHHNDKIQKNALIILRYFLKFIDSEDIKIIIRSIENCLMTTYSELVQKQALLTLNDFFYLSDDATQYYVLTSINVYFSIHLNLKCEALALYINHAKVFTNENIKLIIHNSQQLSPSLIFSFIKKLNKPQLVTFKNDYLRYYLRLSKRKECPSNARILRTLMPLFNNKQLGRLLDRTKRWFNSTNQTYQLIGFEYVMNFAKYIGEDAFVNDFLPKILPLPLIYNDYNQLKFKILLSFAPILKNTAQRNDLFKEMQICFKNCDIGTKNNIVQVCRVYDEEWASSLFNLHIQTHISQFSYTRNMYDYVFILFANYVNLNMDLKMAALPSIKICLLNTDPTEDKLREISLGLALMLITVLPTEEATDIAKCITDCFIYSIKKSQSEALPYIARYFLCKQIPETEKYRLSRHCITHEPTSLLSIYSNIMTQNHYECTQLLDMLNDNYLAHQKEMNKISGVYGFFAANNTPKWKTAAKELKRKAFVQVYQTLEQMDNPNDKVMLLDAAMQYPLFAESNSCFIKGTNSILRKLQAMKMEILDKLSEELKNDDLIL